jgi:hypothetical protein
MGGWVMQNFGSGFHCTISGSSGSPTLGTAIDPHIGYQNMIFADFLVVSERHRAMTEWTTAKRWDM